MIAIEHSARRKGAEPMSARTQGLTFTDPDQVSLQTALDALADPVRRIIVRELASVPDWTHACGSIDLPVTKATRTHHFAILRTAGLLEQRDEGSRRLNRLRRKEFDRFFPGLIALVLAEQTPA
jgi:DNA-binding transcriptional ArsR family regulator